MLTLADLAPATGGGGRRAGGLEHLPHHRLPDPRVLAPGVRQVQEGLGGARRGEGWRRLRPAFTPGCAAATGPWLKSPPSTAKTETSMSCVLSPSWFANQKSNFFMLLLFFEDVFRRVCFPSKMFVILGCVYHLFLCLRIASFRVFRPLAPSARRVSPSRGRR